MSAKSDADFMREAIDLSMKSARVGEAPFGAVIVKDGRIVARGADRVVRKIDPTAHAEMIAIRQAASRLKTHDLSGCKIYTSSIPCQMCIEAIKIANIDEVFYACTAEDIINSSILKKYQHSALVKDKMEIGIPSTNIMRQEAVESIKIWEKVTESDNLNKYE